MTNRNRDDEETAEEIMAAFGSVGAELPDSKEGAMRDYLTGVLATIRAKQATDHCVDLAQAIGVRPTNWATLMQELPKALQRAGVSACERAAKRLEEELVPLAEAEPPMVSGGVVDGNVFTMKPRRDPELEKMAEGMRKFAEFQIQKYARWVREAATDTSGEGET